jgi:hypothetical protein
MSFSKSPFLPGGEKKPGKKDPKPKANNVFFDFFKLIIDSRLGLLILLKILSSYFDRKSICQSKIAWNKKNTKWSQT